MRLNELMESKGGNKKSSSSSSSSKSLFYEAPLGYSIEDIRPHGGIKKFRSAAYSNVSYLHVFCISNLAFALCVKMVHFLILCSVFAVRPKAILSSAKFQRNPSRSLILHLLSKSVFLLLPSFSRSLACCLLLRFVLFPPSSFTVAAYSLRLSFNSIWHCQPLQLDLKASKRGLR